MTPEQFCYWLQGRAELMPDTPPNEAEWKMIAEHLATVFTKKTGGLEQLRGLEQYMPKSPPFYKAPDPIPMGHPQFDPNRVYCTTYPNTAARTT